MSSKPSPNPSTERWNRATTRAHLFSVYHSIRLDPPSAQMISLHLIATLIDIARFFALLPFSDSGILVST
jgi:hypothetical protein